ncbi:tyrosine-type recombinase/integrase [Janthinobacterium lividum]|uniref:tyrosine-type recombinase/integrase n=1 Tax=Janthinobacterium lividum TaxID=29581 RepID=UPI0009B8A4B1|nr:site-specific integrase [Janthinobacterium lividum]
MTGSSGNFRKIIIFPKRDFGTEGNVAKLGGVTLVNDTHFLFFNYVAVAAILDSSGHISWSPTHFLLNIARRSASTTGDTVRTYSESLLVLLNFLSARNLCPSDVTDEQWGAFRAYLRRGARNYSLNTVNLHLNVAASYLRWGQEAGQIDSQFGKRLLGIQKSGGRELWRRHSFDARSEIIQLPAVRRAPQFVSPADFQRLVAEASPPYRLQFKWAMCTGLRRFEICSLRISDLNIATPVDANKAGLFQLHIVRKGGRLKSVYVPAALIDETRWYILVERNRPSPGFEDDIFLNSYGKRVSRQSLTQKFREVANHHNMSATLHHLRHTFAMQVLARLQKYENEGDPINALKSLQILMGHASLETTEIYLDAMEVTSDAVAETLGYLYGASL